MPFVFNKLEIPEVILIEPKIYPDERGFMMESYRYSDFKSFGIDVHFVQDNHSKSAKKGVLRGLHYQLSPHAQDKLVRVIKGSVFDIAVDIRKESATFGKWVSATLSEENRKMLFIPKGFAHGFCTLEDNTEVEYKCSDTFFPDSAHGIAWDDPDINISWPNKSPMLSEKDLKQPKLKDAILDK